MDDGGVVALQGLALAASGVVVLVLFTRIGVRPGIVFTLPLLLIWAGLLQAGIHPTIAGVVVGLAMPTHAWFGVEGFLNVANRAMADFQKRVEDNSPDQELLEPLNRIGAAQREAISPAVRSESLLHPWVAYGIMPLFALANAGVHLSGIRLDAPGAGTVFAGVSLGLLLGKPIGVLLVSWLAIRLGLCVLPQGVNWKGMLVVGCAAGIGFTMAIFIAELAYADPGLLAVAKLGILSATSLAAALAIVAGRALLPKEQPRAVAGITDSLAESSMEVWSGLREMRQAARSGGNS